MKYVYLVFFLIIIYLLYCYYLKYSNQENFDPSLVPVSSIVTLAKVAQKLVDGGGTLTNPGNLQIGMPSAGANGNLNVTGDTTTNTLHVTNDATIGGKVIINSNDPGNNFNLASSGGYFRLQNAATGSDIVTVGHNGSDMYVPALFAGNTNITGTTTTSGLTSANGGLSVTGDSTVSGMLNANGNIAINSSNPNITFVKSGIAPANAPQLYSDGSTIHTYNGDFQADRALRVAGSSSLNGGLTVTGNANISGDILTNNHVQGLGIKLDDVLIAGMQWMYRDDNEMKGLMAAVQDGRIKNYSKCCDYLCRGSCNSWYADHRGTICKQFYNYDGYFDDQRDMRTSGWINKGILNF